jgi:shikimate kinase
MRGVGEASGAVTVVNALPTGIGAAFGIGLTVRAEVELRAAQGSPAPPAISPESSRTPIVEATLRDGIAEFHPGARFEAALTLASGIPPAVGLKSSSAVQSAILLAIARAAGASVAPLDVARLGAASARRAGMSATGAFDDALAGLVSGVVVTDNRKGLLLGRTPLEPSLEVVLWVPPAVHPPSPSVRDRFSDSDPAARAAVDAALAGRWTDAMEINSGLVERAMGYAYADLRAALRRRGAIAVGTSGLGPALAAVGPPGRGAELRLALPAGAGERRVVGLGAGRTDPGGPM